jgi:hypothetical protein
MVAISEASRSSRPNRSRIHDVLRCNANANANAGPRRVDTSRARKASRESARSNSSSAHPPGNRLSPDEPARRHHAADPQARCLPGVGRRQPALHGRAKPLAVSAHARDRA